MRAPERLVRVVTLALVALVAAAAPAAAALGPPPLELELTPAVVATGEAITIRIMPAPRAPWPSGMRFDVYVMWATTEQAAFLRADGVWSPVPVAYRRDVDATSPPSVAQWRRPEPPGEIPLAMVVVPSGADPLARTSWLFRPVLRSTRVSISGPAGARDVATSTWIVAAALVATALLLFLPWPRRHGQASSSPPSLI